MSGAECSGMPADAGASLTKVYAYGLRCSLCYILVSTRVNSYPWPHSPCTGQITFSKGGVGTKSGLIFQPSRGSTIWNWSRQADSTSFEEVLVCGWKGHNFWNYVVHSNFRYLRSRSLRYVLSLVIFVFSCFRPYFRSFMASSRDYFRYATSRETRVWCPSCKIDQA